MSKARCSTDAGTSDIPLAFKSKASAHNAAHHDRLASTAATDHRGCRWAPPLLAPVHGQRWIPWRRTLHSDWLTYWLALGWVAGPRPGALQVEVQQTSVRVIPPLRLKTASLLPGVSLFLYISCHAVFCREPHLDSRRRVCELSAVSDVGHR